MGFDAEIRFTGLLAYVPNAELNNKYVRPSSMVVLAPNAGTRSVLGRALDGEELRKHYPVLKFFAGDLEDQGSLPDDAELQWYLEGMEVTFMIEEEVPGLNDFEVFQDLSSTNQVERNKEDFNWGAPMNEIAPDFADINTDVFGEFEAEEDRIISARVLIGQGLLSTHELNKNVDWRFDRILDGTFRDRPLSNEVVLKLKSITKLAVYARPFGVDEKRALILVGRGDEPLLLEIGNLCEQCLFASSYDEGDGREVIDEDESGLDRIRRDEDFRWYYELASGSAGIREILIEENRASLPIPFPVRVNQGAGSRLVECMRVTYNAYDPAAGAEV